jgi:hypothetical protein
VKRGEAHAPPSPVSPVSLTFLPRKQQSLTRSFFEAAANQRKS